MSELSKAAWVFLGAGCGGVSRYLLQAAFNRRFPEFPWGTLTINILGSLLIGLYFSWEATRPNATVVRFLIPTGLLGGFTTFSAFSAESLRLYAEGARMAAVGYVLLSVVLSLVACALGLWAGGQWFR